LKAPLLLEQLLSWMPDSWRVCSQHSLPTTQLTKAMTIRAAALVVVVVNGKVQTLCEGTALRRFLLKACVAQLLEAEKTRNQGPKPNKRRRKSVQA